MNVLYLAEGYKYKKDELHNLLGLDLISELLKKRVLVKLTDSSLSSYILEEDEIEKEEPDLMDKSSYLSYVFDFVGFIVYCDICLFVYPKYYLRKEGTLELRDPLNEDEIMIILPQLSTVMYAVKKYRDSKTRNITDTSIEEVHHIRESRMAMMLYFLFDYYENGIYSNRKEINEVNGNGEINWNLTIDSFQPFFVDNKPYYVSYYNQRMITNKECLASKIHAAVLKQCSDELASCGILEFLGLSEIYEIDSNTLDSLGDINVLEKALINERRSQFNTRKYELLSNLIAFLGEEGKLKVQSEAHFFGTRNFNVIWEKAVSIAFGDVKDKKICEVIKDSTEQRTFSEYIKKPFDNDAPYYDINNQKYSSSSLRPDCICVNPNTFAILDAKYYLPETNNIQRSLTGMPGVGDIIKQHMYQKGYEGLYGNRKKKNYFILPTCSSTKNVGIGRMPSPFFSEEVSDIDILFVNADRILKAYIQNNKDIKLVDDIMFASIS